MITFQKYLVYIMSTLLMIASLIFMPEISDSLSPIYALVIGGFIGIDLCTTILKTKQLPEGEFKPLKRDRYVVCSIFTSITITIALIMDKKYEANVMSTITMLSMTLMSIGALFIGALEGNKFVTSMSPKIKKETTETEKKEKE